MLSQGNPRQYGESQRQALPPLPWGPEVSPVEGQPLERARMGNQVPAQAGCPGLATYKPFSQAGWGSHLLQGTAPPPPIRVAPLLGDMVQNSAGRSANLASPPAPRATARGPVL